MRSQQGARPDVIRIRSWDRWQTYRRDRGQPPWIKVHRQLLRDRNWVALSDAQRGQLISMWIIAADADGQIPADPALIAKLCYMDEEPDLELFVRYGFIERDATATSRRRHDVTPEAETEAEAETEERLLSQSANADVENSIEELPWNARLGPLARKAGGEKKVADWLKKAKSKPDYYEQVLTGLVGLRDRGALSFVAAPGDPISPAILSVTMEGQPIEQRAIAEYWRIERTDRSSNGLERLNE